MHTTLDDTATLSLLNGESIRLSPHVKLLFEVSDLSAATPAVVSRCRIVHMDTVKLGTAPMLEKWLATHAGLRANEKRVISELFKWLMAPLLRFLREQCETVFEATDAGLLGSLTALAGCLLDRFHERADGIEAVHYTSIVESIFLFSLIWSVGACVADNYLQLFDKFFRDVCTEVKDYKLTCMFPYTGTVFDYALDIKSDFEWRLWKDAVNTEPLPRADSFDRLWVPSASTAPHTYLMQRFYQHRRPFMLVAPRGVGSTSFVAAALRDLSATDWVSVHASLTAGTTVAQLQSQINSVLVLRKRHTYGPSDGRKAVVFLDDVGVVSPDACGAQAPCELVRQHLDHGAWCDVGDMQRRDVVDTHFAGTLKAAHAQDGRVSSRFLRHFSLVAMHALPDDALKSVFTAVMTWHTAGLAPPSGKETDRAHFTAKMMRISKQALAATVDVMSTLSERLPATPATPHYRFGVRDVANVTRGLCLSESDSFVDAHVFLRLWLHECMRVFCDRLVSDDDAAVFVTALRRAAEEHTKLEFDKLCHHLDDNGDGKVNTVRELRALHFGRYLAPVVSASTTAYAELQVASGTFKVVGSGGLSGDGAGGIAVEKSFNDAWRHFASDFHERTGHANLLMFPTAIDHCARLVRALQRSPDGHTILAGAAQSGKKSLALLAAFICEYEVLQISVTPAYTPAAWRADIRNVLLNAGGKDQPTVLLLEDGDARFNCFMEDIALLVTAREVAGFWSPDEQTQIVELVRPEAKALNSAMVGTPTELLAFFSQRVRANLHVVLCMRGDDVARRMRDYACVIDACNVIWFQPPSHSDLEAMVTNQLRRGVEIGFGVGVGVGVGGGGDDAGAPAAKLARNDTLGAAVAKACRRMHLAAVDAAANHDDGDGDGAHVAYAINASCAHFIRLFRRQYSLKKRELVTHRAAYTRGLTALSRADGDSVGITAKLERLAPVIATIGEETAEMLTVMRRENTDSAGFRGKVARDEETLTRAADDISRLEADCADDLAEARPILEAAHAALDTVTATEIAELAALSNPPPGVRLVMEVLCLLLDVSPEGSDSGDDYWQAACSQLLTDDSKLVERLKAVDMMHVSGDLLRSYLSRSEFDINKIKRVSRACHSLCSWVYATEAYERVIQLLTPKTEQATLLKAEYAKMDAKLTKQRVRHERLESKLAALQTNLDGLQLKKREIEQQIEGLTNNQTAATTLLAHFATERERWHFALAALEKDDATLIGDSLVACGVIAYLSAAAPAARASLVARWVAILRNDATVPCSPDFEFTRSFATAVRVDEWVTQGLPQSVVAAENAVIARQTLLYPLILDPLKVCAAWIKESEKANNVVVVSITAPDFYNQLETAIRLGLPCLVEDVGEAGPDPGLEPLFRKRSGDDIGGSGDVISIGSVDIEWNDTFFLYMTTAATATRAPRNAAIARNCTVIDFVVSGASLEDRLFDVIAGVDDETAGARLYQLRTGQVLARAKMEEGELRVLAALAAADGELLDDLEASTALNEMKRQNDEVAEIYGSAEKQMSQLRDRFTEHRWAARRQAALLGCVLDLSRVSPLCHFPVDSFTVALRAELQTRPESEAFSQSIDHATFAVVKLVARALVDEHRSLFVLDYCLRIMLLENTTTDADVAVLLTPPPDESPAAVAAATKAATAAINAAAAAAATGSSSSSNSVTPPPPLTAANPVKAALTQAEWLRLCRLSTTHVAFASLPDAVTTDPAAWTSAFNSLSSLSAPLPDDWGSCSRSSSASSSRSSSSSSSFSSSASGSAASASLNDVHRLVLVRWLRPESFAACVARVVAKSLGQVGVIPLAFVNQYSLRSLLFLRVCALPY
jgi:dynein heavy chain